jgi:hypothetical protein
VQHEVHESLTFTSKRRSEMRFRPFSNKNPRFRQREGW